MLLLKNRGRRKRKKKTDKNGGGFGVEGGVKRSRGGRIKTKFPEGGASGKRK